METYWLRGMLNFFTSTVTALAIWRVRIASPISWATASTNLRGRSVTNLRIMSVTTSYRVVEPSASCRPASVRSRSISTVMSRRWACLRSDSVTPMCASTSRSLMMILSTHDLRLGKKLLQFAKVLADQVGPHGAQFFKVIVASQDRAGADAAGVAGFDIMFHVANEHRLIAVEV